MRQITKVSLVTLGLMVLLSGCQKSPTDENKPTPDSENQTVTETEDKSTAFYQDNLSGIKIKLMDGWEVTGQTDAYTTITPTANNPIQNGCIIVSYQTDYPLDNTYEMYLTTMDLKNILKYTYAGKVYETLGYYNNTPTEEQIGQKAVMIETPTVSLMEEDHNRNKLQPKAKFYHYGGYLPSRCLMVGYISDEESEAAVEAVVRDMIPDTEENRTQVVDSIHPDDIAYQTVTAETDAGNINLQVPAQWMKTNLGKYGTLFRSSYQRGSAYEDSFVFITTTASTPSNDQTFALVDQNIKYIMNATMKSPVTQGGINCDGNMIYEASENKNYLGTTGLCTDAYLNVTSGGTNVWNTDIGGKKETMLISTFTKDNNRYLICLGYTNPSGNEKYKENIKLLSDKIVNSITFN